MNQAHWQSDGSIARFNADRVKAVVEFASHRGVQIILADQRQLRLRVLGFTFGGGSSKESATDVYVRGTDLVATYDESAERPIRAQAYWRRLEAGQFCEGHLDSVLVAIELVLSVNTSLLDSDPQATIETSVSPAIKLKNFGERSEQTLVQPAGERFSYVEMLHPSDMGGTEALLGSGREGEAQIHHRLFQQRLEKGVILRARVRGAVVERRQDTAIAEAAFRQFAASEPPLTV